MLVKDDTALPLTVPLRLSRARRSGFTLVELLTVIGIIGVLTALLLPAVQAVRESSRRTKCLNHLRNQAYALQNYCSAYQRFPAGKVTSGLVEFSWCLESLPYLEQGELYQQFDRTKPWDDARNLAVANASLPVFRCASAITKYDGKTDYGAIIGTSMLGVYMEGTSVQNGLMVEVGRLRHVSVAPGEVTDGLSQTLALGESSDRPQDFGGRWISGANVISQNDGVINQFKRSDIFSNHPNGANVALADGSVKFLSKNIPALIVGALCTRGGGETIGDY